MFFSFIKGSSDVAGAWPQALREEQYPQSVTGLPHWIQKLIYNVSALTGWVKMCHVITIFTSHSEMQPARRVKVFLVFTCSFRSKCVLKLAMDAGQGQMRNAMTTA